MIVDVNGTEVVVRTKVPARDGYKLMPIVEKCSGDFEFAKLSYEDMTAIINVLVESWDFEGDPGTEEGVGDLDLKDMLATTTAALGAYWGEEEGDELTPKN